MKETSKNFAKGAAAGIALGAIAGAVAGILLAPKSGKETRKDIAKYIHEMKDKIAEELHKAGEFSKEKYNQVVHAVVAGYKEGKKISEKEAKDIKSELEKGYDKVKAAAKK